MTASQIFETSDGDLTKQYYSDLNKMGVLGKLAVAVFRAQKCSIKAKSYRKRAWKNDAYGRKQWSIDELEKILRTHAEALNITYGWKEDPKVVFADKPSWVFYVDLPTGQVSFHCPDKGYGILYQNEWDQCRGESTGRILKFCDQVYEKIIV